VIQFTAQPYKELLCLQNRGSKFQCLREVEESNILCARQFKRTLKTHHETATSTLLLALWDFMIYNA